MLRDDHAIGADKRVRPERRRLREHHFHRKVVHFLDLDTDIAARCHRGRRRVFAIFPVEHQIIGGQRLAIVELHARLQLPGHRGAIRRQPTIGDAGDFGGQHSNQIALAVPVRQRLIKQPRCVRILGAGGEMRVEQGWRLPPKQLQRPTTAAFGRCLGVCGLGGGDRKPTGGQQLGCHRRREAHRRHAADEGPARQPPSLHLVDHAPKIAFVHRKPLLTRDRAVNLAQRASQLCMC